MPSISPAAAADVIGKIPQVGKEGTHHRDREVVLLHVLSMSGKDRKFYTIISINSKEGKKQKVL